MEAHLVSIGVVALRDMGDKTQLLALLLAANFKRPIPMILGIFAATFANHTLARALGAWIVAQLGPQIMRWVVGLGFIGMADWVLIPDKADEGAVREHSRFGLFGTTVAAFFPTEMGDKTQITTAALAAHYDSLLPVVAGTTLGMLLADVPAVFLGDAVARRFPLRIVRGTAAAISTGLGLLTLLNVGDFFQEQEWSTTSPVGSSTTFSTKATLPVSAARAQ